MLLLFFIVGCSLFESEPEGSYLYRYPVQRGDTLSGIAGRFNVSVRDLQELNNLSNPNRLSVGQTLKIPSAVRTGTPRAEPAVHRSSRSLPLGRSAGYVGNLSWPVRHARAKIISRFGKRGRRFHEGVDIKAPSGVPVLAAHDGKVVKSNNDMRGYGNIVVIEGDGLTTVYAHNTRNRVRAGSYVRQGQHIADVGRTGNATTPHLHFETRLHNSNGKRVAVDPMTYFP